jgi:7-carboxy-7-deazaguanine synthase
MHEKNLWENLDYLKPSDEIKFVLANRSDYDWMKMMLSEYRMSERFNILVSAAFGLLKPKDLAAWMVEDRLKARLNLQQHKYIWHPRQKGV